MIRRPSPPRGDANFLSASFPVRLLLSQNKEVSIGAKKIRRSEFSMGQPSFEASNAIIYLTYGAFLYEPPLPLSVVHDSPVVLEPSDCSLGSSDFTSHG